MPRFNGLLTHTDLDAVGVPRSTVRDRCRRGVYRRVLPGVFALGALDHLALCRAVTLWRADAVVSHASAAALWGMGPPPDRVGATVPARVRLRSPGWLHLHRRDLTDDAVTTGWGMPVVTAERAFLDGMLTGWPLVQVNAALSTVVGAHAVRARTVADAGSWGVGPTRRELRLWAPGWSSEPEHLLGRALRARGRRLQAQAQVLGYRVDLLHRPTRTVVEVDGREFHSAPDVFVRDRVRQNVLLTAGLLVLRHAAARVLGDPDEVADEVCAVLDARRGRIPWAG